MVTPPFYLDGRRRRANAIFFLFVENEQAVQKIKFSSKSEH